MSISGPLGSYSNGPNGVSASNPLVGGIAAGPNGIAASNPFGGVQAGPNGISLTPPPPKPAGKG
jgi:hypothetical protein